MERRDRSLNRRAVRVHAACRPFPVIAPRPHDQGSGQCNHHDEARGPLRCFDIRHGNVSHRRVSLSDPFNGANSTMASSHDHG